MRKPPSHNELAALRMRGVTWPELAARYRLPEKALRDRYAREQRAMRNRRDGEYRDDKMRPGVTVTFANKHLTAFVTVTRNGPGGPLINLLDLVDAVGRQWGVLTVSTTRTISADLKRKGRETGPEADYLSRINRIGRLHPSLWPRSGYDRSYIEHAAAQPRGEGQGKTATREKRRAAQAD